MSLAFCNRALLIALLFAVAVAVPLSPYVDDAAASVDVDAAASTDVDAAADVDANVQMTGNFNMFLTCDNEFDLFVNGVKVGSGSSWTTTYNVKADVRAGDVIAIDGRDQGGPAAFIGVFNGVPTKASDWRCKDTASPPSGWNTNSFDDSAWAKATSYGRNDGDNVWRSVSGGSRPNIPAQAEWIWTGNNNNHDRVFCRYKPTQSAADSAKAALAAQNGDYKALFAAMMEQVKSGMEAMKIDSVSEFQSITTRRDTAKAVLDQRITSANEREKAFQDASAAFQTADQACTSAKDAAISTLATFNSASAEFNVRNPVIDKELAVIRQLIDKVGELKSINLQESSGQAAARTAVLSKTRDIILNLQTFEPEAGPLSDMIELAREHAEFTKPILDLLNQLIAKLLAERDTISAAVLSAKTANNEAQSISTRNCDRKESSKIEQANAQSAFNSASGARNGAQQEFDDLQKMWETARSKSESALQAYTEEMLTLSSLQSCAVQAQNPLRKSCWEIKSLHSDASSGTYKIAGPDGQPLTVTCDMTAQGGGWTLAGVAMFSNRGKAGWNDENWLNQANSGSLSSHWHMSSDFMNSLASNGEYRVNCFESNNNYERLWKGVRAYKWTQVTPATSSTSLDGTTSYATAWAAHHWGLTSGSNERDAVITSHSNNEWACAGNQGPNGEGYTGRGGRSNMRIWLR